MSKIAIEGGGGRLNGENRSADQGSRAHTRTRVLPTKINQVGDQLKLQWQ